MNVLHFCKSFSLLSETFIYDYVTELERQGEDNHVVTFRRVNEDSRPFPKVSVVDRPSRWHPRRLWNRALVPIGLRKKGTSFWPQIHDRLESAVRQVSPDVIHAHFGPAGVLVAPVAQRLGIPLIVTFYGYDISELVEERFWRECYSRLWSRIEYATVLSEDMKQAAIELGAPDEKLRIVHLSRNLKKFPFRFPSRKARKVLFVGRLVEKKAPKDAVEALQLANEKGAKLELGIVGDGVLRTQVQAFVEERGVEADVTLYGRVPNEKVTDLMNEADVFLLPSKTAPNGDREGTPTVLVEAQSVGLPCVSTRHAGIPEMIPEANHDLLANEGDTEALGEILYSLADRSVDDLERIARRGRRKVENNFSLRSEVNMLRKMYKKSKYKAEI
ncbi:glycosyltransferase [Salinibacter ruber]|uniref:glycosyltransferase n=1 Tax=Salinibacter ruber TaxID=146919 RepID=UPI000E58DCC4|nr:glycosyltransferase [Salinibacter ruber]